MTRGRNLRGIGWLGLAWAGWLAVAPQAVAGMLPEGIEVRADLFAQEGRDILYAMGHVRLQRGTAVITADAAVIWITQREAYLEGRVVYRFGHSVVESEKAYVHWTRVRDEDAGKEHTAIDRGFLFHADIRWSERPDRIPWHVRADEVLQTDLKHFTARRRVTLSPCQYYEPHTYFRAREVQLISEESIVAQELTYHVQGMWVPPTYWPKLYIPLGWEWPQLRIEVGSSNRFGFYVRTEVLYDLSPGTIPLLDAQVGFRLDYFSERGPAYGGIFRYRSAIPGKSQDVRGELDFYHVPSDHGEDLGRYGLGRSNRYRLKFFHSQDMPEGWEFDFEYNRYSDAGFRREYFEHEYYEDRPIDDRAYLKYSTGPLSLYAHYRWRENKFLDTTEYLPQVGVNVLSYPIWRNLLYTGHLEAARVRRRLAQVRVEPLEDMTSDEVEDRLHDLNFHHNPLRDTLQESLSDDRSFWRLDTSHQLSLPFQAGVFRIVPFVGWRGTYYSRALTDDRSQWRHLAFAGARVSTAFWRAWDPVRSDGLRVGGAKLLPLDVTGLRHVVSPELRVMALARPSARADELILTDGNDELQPPADLFFRRGARRYEPYDPTGLQFGDMDALSRMTLVSFSLRNRWQTRRGDRVVDLLDLDPSIHFITHDNGDPFNRSRAELRADLRFRPVDGVLFFGDFCYNLSNKDKTLGPDADDQGFRPIQDSRGSGSLDYLDLGLSIATSERWQLALSQRYELFQGTRYGARLTYVLSDRWRIAVQFATGGGSGNSLSLRFTRDLHDWIAEIVIESDRETSNRFAGFRLSPKSRRELIGGLYYTRDLAAGVVPRRPEAVQQFDY